MKHAPQMFPLFVKLTGRRCLVAGAGSIAESKIAGLLDTGARILVVAPDATVQVRTWARARKIVWRQRAFRSTDLRGMFLVVAATSSTPVHEKIYRLARRVGVLCNIVDVPHLCDFYYPAVVRRGALQIAVSTTGHSPALAQRLRKELESHFGEEYAAWLASLARARAKLNKRRLPADKRKRLLHDMVTPAAFDSFLRSLKQRRSK